MNIHERQTMTGPVRQAAMDLSIADFGLRIAKEPQIRNPKSEIRNPAAAPGPKSKIQNPKCLRWFITLLLLFGLAPMASARDWYREGERLVDAGQPAAGAEAYERFVSERPMAALAPAGLMAAAWAWLDAGKPDSALKALDRLTAYPEQERMMDLYLYTLGVAGDRAGKPGEAINSFQQLAARFPGSPLVPDSRRLLVASLTKTRRYAEALAIADPLVAAAPRNIELLRLRCEIHMKSGDYARALSDLDRILELEPAEKSEEDLFQKALLAERAGVENLNTLARYALLFPAGPHAARVYRMMADQSANALYRRDKLRAAVLLGDVEPYGADNRMALAEVCHELGDDTTAIREWKLLIARHPVSQEAMTAISRLREELEEPSAPDPDFCASLRTFLRNRREDLRDEGRLEDALLLLAQCEAAFAPPAVTPPTWPQPSEPAPVESPAVELTPIEPTPAVPAPVETAPVEPPAAAPWTMAQDDFAALPATGLPPRFDSIVIRPVAPVIEYVEPLTPVETRAVAPLPVEPAVTAPTLTIEVSYTPAPTLPQREAGRETSTEPCFVDVPVSFDRECAAESPLAPARGISEAPPVFERTFTDEPLLVPGSGRIREVAPFADYEEVVLYSNDAAEPGIVEITVIAPPPVADTPPATAETAPPERVMAETAAAAPQPAVIPAAPLRVLIVPLVADSPEDLYSRPIELWLRQKIDRQLIPQLAAAVRRCSAVQSADPDALARYRHGDTTAANLVFSFEITGPFDVTVTCLAPATGISRRTVCTINPADDAASYERLAEKLLAGAL